MNREEIERIVEEAAAEARGKTTESQSSLNREKARAILNAIFLLLAMAGVLLYFTVGHLVGLIVIGVALVVKIVEFFIRFMC